MSLDSQATRTVSPQLDMADSQGPIERHSKFYALDDGIIFLIENRLYRLSRRLLNQSEFFKDMFEIASPHVGNELEGMSDDRPINPGGVTKFQMDSLLALLQASLLDGDLNLTLEQCIAILHLSNKWVFRAAKDYAVSRIEGLRLDPITRIQLARQNDVPKWLKDAYIDLCQRSTLLTAEEVGKIGIDASITIAGIREKMLLDPRLNSIGSCLNCGAWGCSQCSRRCACGSGGIYRGGNARCSACQRGCGCGSNYTNDANLGTANLAFLNVPRDSLGPMVEGICNLQTFM